MWRAIVCGLVLAACNGQLGVGPIDGGDHDADNTRVDAPSSVDAPPDAPACFNGRIVFLAFDGVTITKAITTDATQNQASWIGVTTATIPPYHSGNTNRMGQISNITANVTASLAGYPITVVTKRPTTGPYVMIAFGGTNTIVGSTYTYATSDHDCGDLVKSDLGWVSDTTPNAIVASTAVGTIGWGLGLQGTTDPNDCMCGWASTCTQATTPTCTLGTALTTGTSASPATTCPGLNPQDEHAAFSAAFCN